MSRIIRPRLGDVAKAIGERPGTEGELQRVPKARRDYTARELRDMAKRAAAGDAPAGSPADFEIRRSELAGDFERANALRREVKEKATALGRLARAAEKAERRAARRHIHICKDWPSGCGPEGMGPCACECGAIAVVSRAENGRVVWRRRDGTEDPFPDPREAEHPKAKHRNTGG